MDTSPEVLSKEEGLRLLKAGQIDDAIRVLDKVREETEDAQVYAYLGAAYSKKNDNVRAISAFEKSLSLDETSRAYFNLAMAYECVGRIDEAVREYRMATDLDPNYVPAKDALTRIQNQFAATHPQPEPVAAAATQSMPAEPPSISQTQSFAGPPPGQAIGHAPQTISDPFAQQHTPPPTREDLIARQMAKEQAVADQHHTMMKSGLIYGAVCGAIFFVCLNFASKVIMPFSMPGWATSGIGLLLYTIITALMGTAYGSIVGLWIGYTCGGDTAGMQAGAAIGAFLGILLGLFTGSLGGVIAFMIGFGLVSGAVGWIIGRMVEASLPS